MFQSQHRKWAAPNRNQRSHIWRCVMMWIQIKQPSKRVSHCMLEAHPFRRYSTSVITWQGSGVGVTIFFLILCRVHLHDWESQYGGPCWCCNACQDLPSSWIFSGCKLKGKKFSEAHLQWSYCTRQDIYQLYHGAVEFLILNSDWSALILIAAR